MRSAARAGLRSDWLVKLLARGRQAGQDAVLDSQVAAIVEIQRLGRFPALESMEPARARRYAAEGLSPFDLDPAPMAEVIDTTIAAIPVRIFVPHDAGLDWIVYYHGGGGVIGSIAGSEPVARYLAAQTKCTVASVGYRLGPEDRHPAGVYDACAAWRGLVARMPTGGHAAVAGDSFGGFLSAHVDRHALETGARRPDLQVLIYPLVDMTLTSPSIERFASGYVLTKATMHWFRSHYLHPEDDPRSASPWFWADLGGSAPALVVTAGFDPLVDEGDGWAARLRDAGVTVRHRRHASLIHGFLSFAGVVRAAHAAADQLCADIVEMLRE